MQIRKYLGATALVAVMAAPAFGQTVITQNSVVDNIDLGGSNFAVVAGPGVEISSIMGQGAYNTLNSVSSTSGGLTVPLQVANNSSFEVRQGAGAAVVGGILVNSGDVDMNAINVIAAAGTGSGVSNVFAAGNQVGSNVVNNALVSSFGASTGFIGQQAGSVDLVATNSMSAVVLNGNAVVGFNVEVMNQSALGSINTAAVSLGVGSGSTPAVLDLSLKQQILEPVTIVATNSALANSTASGSSILDPKVQNLNQSASIALTTLQFGGTGTVTLSGDQNNSAVRNEFTIGNTAVAYTGDPLDPNYGFFSSSRGNGIAIVNNISQTASFDQNIVMGGPGVSINLAGTPGGPTPLLGFTQVTDGATTAIDTPAGGPSLVALPIPAPYAFTGGNVIGGMVNGQGATTDTGTATVSNGDQSFYNTQNMIATGGTLGGVGSQSATNVGSANSPNVAWNGIIAQTEDGAAAVTGNSQLAKQTFNAANAGTLTGAVAQNTDFMNMAQGNVQVASGSTGATITGANQQSGLSLNSFNVGSLSGGSLAQTAGTVTLANGNILVAQSSTAQNVSVGGSQLALTSVNTGSLGAALGGSVTQVAGDVRITNVNTMNALGPFNASVSGTQQSGASINVIK